MKITVCIGSACHLKGSRQVVERLTRLVNEAELSDRVELSGTFCLGHCENGVSVDIDGVVHSVSPETVDDFFAAYELARNSGIRYINTDLIAGLPGDSFASFSATVDKILRMRPDNLTVHTFAVKKSADILHSGTEIYSRRGGETSMCVDYSQLRAKGAGYFPYYIYRQKNTAGNLENVGYAKPGRACLYNIGNMEETASVLALGAGAITKWLFDQDLKAVRQGYDPEELRFSNLQLRIERAPNVRNIEQYIQRVDEMVQRKRALILPEAAR